MTQREQQEAAQRREQGRQLAEKMALQEAKKVKRGKVLCLVYSILSFISAGLIFILSSSVGQMDAVGEVSWTLSAGLIAVGLMAAVFPAFLLAGFSWARIGFTALNIIKALFMLGFILIQEDILTFFAQGMAIPPLILLAYYIAGVVIFGWYQPVRDYQYVRLTKPMPEELDREERQE